MVESVRDLRPVQVLLDTKRFIETPEPQPPRGGKKDFFSGDNRGFLRQKDRIRGRLKAIEQSLLAKRQPLGFVSVQMRDEALGKSYRPIGSLFTESHGFSLVGSGAVGEMLFQATPESLVRLDRIVEARAEETPRVVINEKTGLPEERVSGYRSEVGAIGDITLHDRTDRLSFTAEEAVAWLSQPDVLGGYVIELFKPNATSAAQAVAIAKESLSRGLASIAGGVSVKPFLPSQRSDHFGDPSLVLSVQLTRSEENSIKLPFSTDGQPPQDVGEEVARLPTTVLDLSVAKHEQLLSVLSDQSLVRSIELPPIVEASPASANPLPHAITLPLPQPNADYPVVGIIDGGTSDIPSLRPWRVGDAGLVPLRDRDESHGTFIAGLLAAGANLNPHLAAALEPHGCKFYDLDIFPRRELRATYYRDPDYFFDLLDEKIKAAKREFGARIFNFSFAIRYPKRSQSYTPIADRFDRMARENDVIFVISAGNLPASGNRPIWPTDPAAAVQMLAAFGNREGGITPPAEQFLGLTIGAINPPGIPNHAAEMPATYSRRGPGVGGARKPDLAHFGGVAPSATSSNRTGLTSISPTGEAIENCGTSFAAPNVAATVATLDQRLGRQARREELLVLPVHRASRPVPLQHKNLRHISREFVGFGLPPQADEILMDDPYGVTLVFSEILRARQILNFPFTWPRSLVTAKGACRGRIDLTLAYTPPLDPDHKAEAQRVQLEAYVRQERNDLTTGESTWEPQLKHDGAQVPQGMNKTEKYLLMTGLKWSPIKRYFADMKMGRGNTSNWQLSLESQTRAAAKFPALGIPFTVLLTISDPSQKSPIHDEVRNQLVATGLTIADITVAHRIRPRG